MASEWSSERTEVTVEDTSCPFVDEVTDAGVLDLWYDPPLEGIFPISLPPLGIVWRWRPSSCPSMLYKQVKGSVNQVKGRIILKTY